MKEVPLSRTTEQREWWAQWVNDCRETIIRLKLPRPFVVDDVMKAAGWMPWDRPPDLGCKRLVEEAVSGLSE